MRNIISLGGTKLGHGHDHHHHHHFHSSNKRVLKICFLLIAGFMIIEAVGGVLTNSLALLSDAGHMFSDALALGIALLAFIWGEKAANYRKTYGYRRFEILAAVFNGIALLLIAAYIFYEAFRRFQNPPEVASTAMLIIAVLGLLVNLVVAWIMKRSGDVEENLNMRGAYLHVLSDMLGSIGAILAALLIIFFNWGWADPLASVIVAALILRSGYGVTKAGLHVLMEGTPTNVDIDQVLSIIQNTKGIQSVHDLHVWSITSGYNALSCHAVVDDAYMSVADCERILRHIEHHLTKENIHHMTIQLETADHRHDDSILCTVDADTSGLPRHK